MNKIFKVIWNEARNAYVVVSEIAKNHGSKSCSTKKLLAMLIATGVMTCAGMAPAMAQPVAVKTNDFQYVALKAAAFAEGEPTRWNRDSWNKDFTSLEDAKTEWNAQRKDGQKPLGDYTYKYDAKNGYWVREGYVLTVDKNGGEYTQLSANGIRADVAYTGTGVPEGILQSVTSTVARNGVVTHSGDSLQKVTAGSYAGVSHGGGTEVAGSWNYIINDSSWENSGAEYQNGYVDLKCEKGEKMPKGFKTTDSGLNWDEVKQTYTYQGKAVDYRNMYVIDGKLGVFTNADGSDVYTGTVYGKNNEILMTVKDNGKFYSYWAASVTDPSATMETYPVSKYNSDLAVIDQNIKDLNKDIIKEVTLTKDTNSAIIGLVRNGGNAVDGAITVTSGGGTDGKDTFVKISNVTTEQTFATGSKVEAIVDNGATTGIKINGENYTIKSGSKVSVTQNAAEKTTIITVDGTETTITDTDTTYTEGDGIKISGANAISVSKNLTGMQSINGAGGTINLADSAITVNETTFNKDGRIQNVANGTETKDAVNFGQLQETNNKVENLKVEAGKHTTLVNGENTTVEQVGDGKDGKQYKVNVDLSQYAKTEDVAVVYDANGSLKSTNAKSVGSSAIALGKEATAVANSIAIGDSSIAGYKGTVLGTNAESNREGATLVGYNTNSFGLYSTVVGTNATINTNSKTVYNKIVQGAAATVVGAMNKIDNTNGEGYSGVANGIADNDAVNVSQLNAVATEAGKHTTLSNGKNTTVESTVKDGQTDYKVNVAGDLTDITSVANGDSKINLNKDSIIISNGNKYFAITNSGIGMSYIGADYSAKSIMLGENGTTISGGLNVAGSKITNVAAGEVSSTSTDAINGSQLHAVKTELQTSDKHLVGNPASADSSYKPDANGDISLRVEDQNKNGYDVVIKDVASKAELGDVADRVTKVENKVTQIEPDVTTIKTDITTIKTDINNINTRVDNVEALAGKHTTLEKNGTNINVEETVVDGQKNYKVNLNKDITLGDENGNNVSISGTNGTITATGDITTANRINAANGGKLADIDVTGNKLSNGNSSITLDGTNVKVNDKVTVDKDGKISGVAKGDISNTSTDAVNGSQLYDTNTHITNVENQVISNSNRINQLGNRVNKVGAGAAALAALHPMDFDPDDKLTFSAGYGNYGGENAAAIGAYYRPDEKVMFSVGGTVGNGENMVNAGVSFALDRTNHVSNSRTALAREVIDLRGQLAVMGAKMAKMEKALGMLDETKTKLFPDIPANHWAYEYIAKLAGNGYIEGYPDGNFGGDRLMTRYEFAAMLYRAIENGAALEEKIIKEFEPELGRIRVDRISGEDGDRDKIERVRVNDTKGERDHYGNKLAK